MPHLVMPDLFESLRSFLISRRRCLMCELEIHGLHFVSFALDGILQVIGIAANQSQQFSFLGEMLKTLSLRGLFEQVCYLGMMILAGVLGIKHVLCVCECFSMHCGRKVLFSFRI